MELQITNEMKGTAPNVLYKKRISNGFQRRRDLPPYLRDNLPDKTIYLVRETLLQFKTGFVPDQHFFEDEIKEKYNVLKLREEGRVQKKKKTNLENSFQKQEEYDLQEFQKLAKSTLKQEKTGIHQQWKYLQKVGDKNCNLTFDLIDKIQKLEDRRLSLGNMKNQFQKVKTEILDQTFELKSHQLNMRILNSSRENRSRQQNNDSVTQRTQNNLSLDLAKVMDLNRQRELENLSSRELVRTFQMPVFSANLVNNKNVLISNYLNPNGNVENGTQAFATRENSTGPNSSRELVFSRRGRCSTAQKSNRYNNQSQTITYSRVNTRRESGDQDMLNLLRSSSSSSSFIQQKKSGFDVTLDDLTRSFQVYQQEVSSINPDKPLIYQVTAPNNKEILQKQQKGQRNAAQSDEEQRNRRLRLQEEEREKIMKDEYEKKLIKSTFTKIVSRNLIELNLNKKIGIPSSSQPPTLNIRQFLNNQKYDRLISQINES